MKPILFNTEMVKAILDGRKAMTRRIIKPKYTNTDIVFKNGILYEIQNDTPEDTYDSVQKMTKMHVKACAEIKPRYQVGDILYVRETWTDKPGFENAVHPYLYKADYPESGIGRASGFGKWKPSIHMPREIARIFLRATNVRVERVQDITEEDAMEEGVKDPYDYQDSAYYEQPHMRGLEINKSAFAGLWDSTIKKKDLDKYGWDANPWVWVYEFEVTKK